MAVAEQHHEQPHEEKEKKNFFSRLFEKIKSIFHRTRNAVYSVMGWKNSEAKTQNDHSLKHERKESLDLSKISVEEGDITESNVEAIVNSANTSLILGSGVAGAIRDKGGPAVVEECEKLSDKGTKKIEIGEVAVTSGGNLKQQIFHGAVMEWGRDTNVPNVKKTVKNILHEATKRGVKSIAFPAMGAGAGGLSPEMSAAAIKQALQECPEEVKAFDEIKIVIYPDEKSQKEHGYNVVLWVFEKVFEKQSPKQDSDKDLPKAA